MVKVHSLKKSPVPKRSLILLIFMILICFSIDPEEDGLTFYLAVRQKYKLVDTRWNVRYVFISNVS